MKFKNYDEALDFIEKNINEDDYLICETYANYKYGLKAPIVVFIYDYPNIEELEELHDVINIHTTNEGILDCNNDRFFLTDKELYPDIEPYWIYNGDEVYNEQDLLEDEELLEEYIDEHTNNPDIVMKFNIDLEKYGFKLYKEASYSGIHPDFEEITPEEYIKQLKDKYDVIFKLTGSNMWGIYFNIYVKEKN